MSKKTKNEKTKAPKGSPKSTKTPKGTKKPKGKDLKKFFQQAILEMLDHADGRGYSIKQLLKKLDLKKRDDIKLATLTIYQLEDDDQIKALENGNFVGNRTLEELTGIIDH